MDPSSYSLSFLTILAHSSVTYIFVIDTFHEHQLPVCPLGMGLVLEGSAQLLDGYISVQDSIIARTVKEKKCLVFMWITLSDYTTLWQSTMKVNCKNIIFHISEQTKTCGKRWQMTLFCVYTFSVIGQGRRI